MSDADSDYVPTDYRTLIKIKHYIDLPGEPPKSKLWCGVNNLIILRKQRDVVFDIKLGNGATYTVTTDKPKNEYSRFYDPKRKLNTTNVTFQDGEPCHIWLGRTFQGSLILKQGDKVLGRYPIRKMDCTQGCTEEPKDKPAPMLIILHDDKSLSQSLQALVEDPQGASRPAMPVANDIQAAAAPVPFSEVKATVSRDVLPMLHAFKIKQTYGSLVPPDLVDYFASGTDSYKWDPLNTISRNFLWAQVAGAGGYGWDTFGPKGELRGFWNRVFIIRRDMNGEFTLFFQTSKKERDLLGFLLTTYRARPSDVKVMTIAGGAGSLSATSRAGWAAASAAVNIKTMTGKSMGFAIAMDTFAWWHDFETRKDDGTRTKDFANLLATVGVDVAQMWMVTYLSTGFVSTFLTGSAALIAGTITTPIWIIAIGALFITFTVSYFVGAPFSHKDGENKTIGDHLADVIRRAGTLLEQQLPRDYPETFSQSTWQISPVGATP